MTATPTASATATAGTPTATATSTPTAGPQAGDILIAGGDTGGSLSGFIPLSTSTNPTASAEIYQALTDAFTVVGSMNAAREATATAVVLPNNKTLVVGGSHCAAKTYGRAVSADRQRSMDSSATRSIPQICIVKPQAPRAASPWRAQAAAAI